MMYTLVHCNRNWVTMLSGVARCTIQRGYAMSFRDKSLTQVSSHSTSRRAYHIPYKVTTCPSGHFLGSKHLKALKVIPDASVMSAGIMSAASKQQMMDWREVRQDARDIFLSSVSAVYPPQMIHNALKVSQDGDTLTVDGRDYVMNNNVYIVGFGKAVSGMARGMEDLVGRHIVQGVISIPYGSTQLFKSIGKSSLCVRDHSKIVVYEGAKDNMPDEDSHVAAMAILDLTQNLGTDDILIVLISGGGSALLPSPVHPISLQDQIIMNKVLSTHGASIQQLNVLRQNIETLKGGGLAQIAKPAKVISLVLSDVLGDKLDIISSGPTVPLLSSPRQCLQILDRLNVKAKIPPVVMRHLMLKASDKKAVEESSPHLHHIKSYASKWDHVQNVIIGSNTIATKAALQKANEMKYVSMVMTNSLQGEAKKAAAMFIELVKYVIYRYGDRPPDQGKSELSLTEIELTKHGVSKETLKSVAAAASQGYNSHKGVCIICGGETIVNVTGTGKGGRNTEMALAFALKYTEVIKNDVKKSFPKFHVEFLSAGTDGQDGPTDAAGAVVNSNLVPMAITAKMEPSKYLSNNDSYTLFKSLPKEGDCLIQTGLTGTNVMDLQVLIIKPVNNSHYQI